jgi:hypothetical protein
MEQVLTRSTFTAHPPPQRARKPRDPNAITEEHMIYLLARRYNAKAQNGALRYVVASHVRDDVSWSQRRTADFIALDTSPSSHLSFHGHEIKCSRSDWRTELRDPTKSEAFLRYMDYWWLVVADPLIVREGELPENWGLLVRTKGEVLRVKRHATRLTPVPEREDEYPYRPKYTPTYRGFLATFARAAQQGDARSLLESDE